MAKVILNRAHKNEPMLYSYILGAMRNNDISQSDMASDLGISQQVFSYKLKNGTLTVTDLLKIFDKLKPDDSTLIKLLRG